MVWSDYMRKDCSWISSLLWEHMRVFSAIATWCCSPGNPLVPYSWLELGASRLWAGWLVALISAADSSGMITEFVFPWGVTSALSHFGSLCHNWFTDNSSNVKPLDSMSAGLVLARTVAPNFGRYQASCLISATLLRRKGFHSLSVPHTQNDATWESVTYLSSFGGRVEWRLSGSEVISLERRSSNNNSSLGILCAWRGAT